MSEAVPSTAPLTPSTPDAEGPFDLSSVHVLSPQIKIESTRIAQFFAYWRTLAGDRETPDWNNFDAVTVPSLMPNMLVADVTLDPLRVYYRLVGTRVAELNGYDFTGRYLDEILTHTSNRYLHAFYSKAVVGKLPVLDRFVWHMDDGRTSTYDLAVFPFAGGLGGETHRALSIECYDRIEHKIGPHFYRRPRVRPRNHPGDT